MNLFRHFEALVQARIAALSADGTLPAGLDPAAASVEPPRDPAHGDLATNAALALARQAGRKPREIAEPLAAELARLPGVAGVEVAGPGFINLRLTADFWRARLADILEAGPAYGDSDIGKAERVNVEYVSANPTGPLHVGHVRGAVYGDALAALLAKAGFAVTREYYINDAGNQVETLARSAHLRYREALGEAVGEIPDGMYPGDYLVPVGRALAERDGARWREAPEAEWLPVFRAFAVERMMAQVREDLEGLGVRQDVFFSEMSLHRSGEIDAAYRTLEERGLIYTGVLEPPKGKLPDDWEPRPQTLFRATQFGDEVDRPLKKSNGEWTYFAADIAYHFDKYRRGFANMVDVWGADHGGYVKRMQAAVKALTDGKGALDVKLCQIVRVLRGGEPVRMSKRAGEFVTLAELLREVGRDVVRFIMLTRRNDAPLDFDFVKVLEQSKDNPVFYVQYAHARCRSVLRNVAREVPAARLEGVPDAGVLARLEHPAELDLVRRLALWPRTVEAAALAHEPHRIAFYLNDLASEFHALWNKGNDTPELRFIVPGDVQLTTLRMALVRAVATVIASGLAIIGVEPVEEMR